MNPLATDVVMQLFGVQVTNTMLTGTLVTIVLALVAVVLRLTLSIWPSRAQVAAERLIEAWQDLAENAGGTRAHRFVPLVGSAFVFILLANWIGALPLKHIRTINPEGTSVELIRSATSDLNLTAAVALMVVVLVEMLEIRSLGLVQYVKGLVVPNPLRWLEMLVRPLSLAFRLFGRHDPGDRAGCPLPISRARAVHGPDPGGDLRRACARVPDDRHRSRR